MAGPRPPAAVHRLCDHDRGRLHRVHDVDEAGPVVIEARPRAAAIVNLGCKVNQSEMEAAARLLREASIPLVDPGPARADLVLVNTCTVTSTADEKSRAAVRRARRANPDAEIVVTGCSVQVGPEAFAGGGRGRRAWSGTKTRRAFLAGARGAAAAGRSARRIDRAALPTLSGVEAVAAAPLDGVADDRASVERTRAFVKVQDGCSFFCTYCIIPRARGAERSLAPGRRPRGRAPGARRRPSRDRPDRDQHRHLRRRLVGARRPRLARPERAHARRARAPDPRRDRPWSGSASARSSRSTSTTSCSRRGSTARRGRCRTSTCRSSRATTACSGGWAAAT